jgi:hypothetical protein
MIQAPLRRRFLRRPILPARLPPAYPNRSARLQWDALAVQYMPQREQRHRRVRNDSGVKVGGGLPCGRSDPAAAVHPGAAVVAEYFSCNAAVVRL